MSSTNARRPTQASRPVGRPRKQRESRHFRLPHRFVFDFPLFIYGAAAPLTIADLSTNAGGTAGGTDVTIRGSGFERGTTVSLDGVPMRVIYNSGTRVYFSTRSHPPGTVELVVATLDGQTDRLIGGYTFVRPQFSDFNGVWTGRLGDESETIVSFTVENDLLVSVSCDTTLELSSSSSTKTGEFAVVGLRGAMTGGLLQADIAQGTISLAGCTTYDTGWFATRRYKRFVAPLLSSLAR